MSAHTVTLAVVPSFSVECKLWVENGGWKGSAEQLAITVQAASFEQAKSELASALGRHVEALVRQGTHATGCAA